MQRLAVWGAGVATALLALQSCSSISDSGFVEIQTIPSSVAATLYLDSEKLDPIKNGDVVLRRITGTSKLQSDLGGGNLTLLCELVVRKDRITTVMVSVLERPPRCQCKNAGAPAAASNRLCAG
jgi:hypothetical protein